MKITNTLHYLFKVMHLLGNVIIIIFFYVKKTVLTPLIFSCIFMTERVFG